MADTLYQLTDDLQEVLNGGLVFDEETGEILFDEDNMDALEASVADKVRACSLYAENIRAIAKSRKDAWQRMKYSAEQAEKKAARIDAYILKCLKKIGGKLETPEATISVRKCPASVQVLHEWEVPKKYWTAKTTESIDKMAVKEALKRGTEVPGCALVVNEKVSFK